MRCWTLDSGPGSKDGDPQPPDAANDPLDGPAVAEGVLGAALVATLGIGSVQLGTPPIASEVAAALFTPLLVQLLHARRRAAERILHAASSISGRSEAQLIIDAGVNDRQATFAWDVLSSGADSTFDQKLVALGRSLAAGIDDDAKLDQERIFARAMAPIDAPHIAVLEAIVALGNDLPTDELVVTTQLLRQGLDEVGPALHPLLATLSTSGLIEVPGPASAEEGTFSIPESTGWRLSEFGQQVLDRLHEASTG